MWSISTKIAYMIQFSSTVSIIALNWTSFRWSHLNKSIKLRSIRHYMPQMSIVLIISFTFASKREKNTQISIASFSNEPSSKVDKKIVFQAFDQFKQSSACIAMKCHCLIGHVIRSYLFYFLFLFAETKCHFFADWWIVRSIRSNCTWSLDVCRYMHRTFFSTQRLPRKRNSNRAAIFFRWCKSVSVFLRPCLSTSEFRWTNCVSVRCFPSSNNSDFTGK